MDRERAEAHLRLLAEEELRRAVTRAWDGTAGSPPDDEGSDGLCEINPRPERATSP
jgi:hypothetical protein